MAVPATPKHTINRVIQSYTTEDPDMIPPRTTIATSPNIGAIQGNPIQPYVFGADAQSGSQAVPPLAAGASFKFSIPIGFPNITNAPVVLGQADFGQFIVNLVAATHGIPGLVIAEIAVTPRAFSQTGVFTKEILQPATTYNAWGALVTGTLFSAIATAGGTLTVRASAVLYDTLA